MKLTPLTEAPLEAVVERLIAEHGVIRSALRDLVELADSIDRALGARLAVAADCLEDHLRKEELVVFPTIVAGRGHLAQGPIAVLGAEHRDHRALLELVRARAGELEADRAAIFLTRFDGFVGALEAHMEREDEVLFPRALRR